jgi:uncharacterized membrane protein
LDKNELPVIPGRKGGTMRDRISILLPVKGGLTMVKRPFLLLAVICVVISLLSISTVWAARAEYEFLEDVMAWNVSPNGQFVVGGTPPFRWSSDTGIQWIDYLPLVVDYEQYGSGYGVSNDGMVVGSMWYVYRESDWNEDSQEWYSRNWARQRAFYWTPGDGTKKLPSVGELASALVGFQAYDISASGEVIVGCVDEYHQYSSEGPRPGLQYYGGSVVRWERGSHGSYSMQIADPGIDIGRTEIMCTSSPPECKKAVGLAVSSDGTTIVGWRGMVSYEYTPFLDSPFLGCVKPGRAFRLVGDNLQFFPGPESNVATCVSADGRTVGGQHRGTPFLWSPASIIDPVANSYPYYLSGSFPAGVSADGEVVVGSQYVNETIPWLWVEKKGVRLLRDVLENDYKLRLSGFTLGRAVAISDDGRVIVVIAKRTGDFWWGTLVIKLQAPPNKIPLNWRRTEPQRLFDPRLFGPPSP